MRGGPIDSARFGSFGKRISVFSQIMGFAFQMGWAAETASQNIALERDALSEPASKRKPHPALMWGLRTKAGP